MRFRLLYLLSFAPLLTDFLESGGLPLSPRDFLTELTTGMLIFALVFFGVREHDRVAAMVHRDPLTGLGNRRAFDEKVRLECLRATRLGSAVWMLSMDLDNFKLINDWFGHEEGDRVLRDFSQGLISNTRQALDFAFRLGGDEFVLLMTGCNEAAATRVAAKLREVAKSISPPPAADALGVSVGMIEFDPREDVGEFLRRADIAMYEEKATTSGRSRRRQNLGLTTGVS